jgi:hypothetical protein
MTRVIPTENKQHLFDFIVWMSDYSIDRRGVCRRFDVSISVLRRGGFQWTMERREHLQENCCLPPDLVGQEQHQLKLR